MGKNLHYTIKPFIENALNNHSSVMNIKSIDDEDYYAYVVHRKNNLSSIIVVLSDSYYFGDESLASKPSSLKNGGFFLIARPESEDYDKNFPKEKLGVGKLKKLLGALNMEDFWNYYPPKKEKN